MIPLRLRIMQALEALLVTTGYPVFRDRGVFGPTDPTPRLALYELAQPMRERTVLTAPIRTNMIGVEAEWPLNVQGFFQKPNDAYVGAALVVQALAAEAQRGAPLRDLLGLKAGSPHGMSPVLGLHVGSPVVRPPGLDEGAPQAYFWLEVTLTIAENRLEPFAWA